MSEIIDMIGTVMLNLHSNTYNSLVEGVEQKNTQAVTQEVSVFAQTPPCSCLNNLDYVTVK